jgi:ribose/xylose/arabinose/galactoside ABC-type transport system permease subunit
VAVAYVVAGATASTAGAFYASQAAQGNLQLGQGLDFDAIAAVLVGGVFIEGGVGSVVDAAIGAIFLAVLTAVLLLHGLSFQTQLMVKGLVVIISVLTGASARRTAMRLQQRLPPYLRSGRVLLRAGLGFSLVAVVADRAQTIPDVGIQEGER